VRNKWGGRWERVIKPLSTARSLQGGRLKLQIGALKASKEVKRGSTGTRTKESLSKLKGRQPGL